jgi:glycosyltransferase involved in cell wall biosynthesis
MKIKVAFLEEDAKIGGAEINVLNLVQKLDSDKIETLIICPCEGPFSDRIKEIGGQIALVPKFPFFSTSVLIFGKKITNPLAFVWNLFSLIPSSWMLARFLKKERIQVLHTNSMLAHFYGAIACRLAGTKCLWHIQDIVDPKQALGLFKRGLNIAGRWLPHRIVVISEAVGKMFDSGTEKKVKIVYNGTDLQKFNSSLSGDSVRKEFGIQPDGFVAGIVGRIVHWKGHKEFLLAARQILNNFPNAKFLIVGDTSFGKETYLHEIKNIAAKLDIQDSVIFTGFRKDIPEILSALDVLVNASTLPEPFGLTIIEAMASEKPVIATDGGGVPEIVVDGVTGKLVPMKDAQSLTAAMLHLIKRPDERKKMGLAAREKVKKYFSKESFVNNMSMQYLELASNLFG